MKRPKPSIATVAAAFRSRGRSKLYSWLWEHFDELPPYEKYRVNWPELTAALTNLGIKGRQDKPLTPDTVRKTYERVLVDRRAVPHTAQSGAPRSPPRPVPPPNPGDYAPVQSLPDSQPRERKRMVLRSPVPLAEGEPAPNDGSRLPAPLRPESKQ
jgi:hypothetical protein